MKKLYEKNEVNFALVWIVAYVVLSSVGDSVSASLGITKVVTAPICVVLTALLVCWIGKNGLNEKYGLVPFRGDAKKYLYFIPLVLLSTTNIWWGVHLNMTVFESALYVLSMLCAGFVEEILFRGFLFKAMCKDNVKTAVVVSSLTFGMGHIVNLLNGKDTLGTLLQVCYAAAVGFLFTILVLKGKSLWPCIITHSAINSLSTFHNKNAITPQNRLIASVFLCVVSLVYVWIILKNTRDDCAEKEKSAI